MTALVVLFAAIVTAVTYLVVIRQVMLAMNSVARQQELRIQKLQSHCDFLKGTIKYAKQELSELHFAHISGQNPQHPTGSINYRKMKRELEQAPSHGDKSYITKQYEGGKLNY